MTYFLSQPDVQSSTHVVQKSNRTFRKTATSAKEKPEGGEGRIITSITAQISTLCLLIFFISEFKLYLKSCQDKKNCRGNSPYEN